jgi:glycosyltransferase involved in cell wall biosynthesis
LKKQIIIAKLFEFGGSNTQLNTLIRYWGKENVILILEDRDQLAFLNNIGYAAGIKVIVKPLYPYAHLRYKFTTNVKEFLGLLWSVLTVQFLSIKYGLANVTISAVEPEKYLYLLWMPFSKVYYILNTKPEPQYTSFTAWTCNKMLGSRKKIITVSNANRGQIIINWNITDRKKNFIYVVYNCLAGDIDQATTDPSQKTSQRLVVTLGHVTRYKNPKIWLETARIVTTERSGIKFIWVGNGSLMEEYQKATESSENIRFVGFTNDTGRYLIKATIYYQPSLSETHGIAVVEAMAHHLPCIVSNIGGLPESIQNEYSGLLVDPENIEQHVKAILSLLDDPDLNARYGQNAYKKYREAFTYEIFKSTMDGIYYNKMA